MSSPFEILEIDEDADEREVERAYRERMLETHPDHGGSAEQFQLVRRAYEEIRDADGDDEDDAEPADVDPDDVVVQPDEPTGTRVEYLNYEVLDDHGWNLGDDALFEKARAADLDEVDHGEFVAEPDEPLLEAAESYGFGWPYACRGGACANCAVAVRSGAMSQPDDHILPDRMLDQGIRLSCSGIPESDDLQVVYNVKHLPGLEELRLPPYPFERATAND